MKPIAAAVGRRLVLKSLAAAPVALAAPAFAQTEAEAVLLTITDLHSPYSRLPALLEAIREVARGPVPAALILNGDLFERGNVAALRSGAAADFAFLEAAAAELPVIVNLGNHETAILDDMASFVARATGAGATVIGNLIDRRTGRFFTPVSTRLGLGGIELALLGVGTDNPFVYRAPVRDSLLLLDPAGFVAETASAVLGDADLPVLVSHAGVTADKAMLDGLAPGTVVLGAHDHLELTHESGGILYLHTGAWGRTLAVHALRRAEAGVEVATDLRAISPGSGDTALAALIDEVLAEHLTDADREVIAIRETALDMPASILVAVEAVRAAAEADAAFLGHTTFGAPLDAGPLTRYDFDAFVRFDGDIRTAEVSGETLTAIMGRANQWRAESLEARTGDYVHTAEIGIDPGATYRIATNGWTAMNQESYLGTTDIVFEEAPGLMLKAVVAEALASG
ncbi:metallophosphoesterase [Histidinibacterium lentulum]|uniref:Bifunctional metallophosphatase/5'-nucleotidase n=1 Tax=Histidinibacterium lentulum TaxID=2480588 RepID=A0A3N2QW41_9RHOB|nr:metallophosphoesterase [Histidinibacterium lentulum]ROT99370.1 bifunctional metallophosphatase/5'-nucleotidase [Histidinibacterium lentulum]